MSVETINATADACIRARRSLAARRPAAPVVLEAANFSASLFNFGTGGTLGACASARVSSIDGYASRPCTPFGCNARATSDDGVMDAEVGVRASRTGRASIIKASALIGRARVVVVTIKFVAADGADSQLADVERADLIRHHSARTALVNGEVGAGTVEAEIVGALETIVAARIGTIGNGRVETLAVVTTVGGARIAVVAGGKDSRYVLADTIVAKVVRACVAIVAVYGIGRCASVRRVANRLTYTSGAAEYATGILTGTRNT